MSETTHASTLRALWQRLRWSVFFLIGFLISEQVFVSLAADHGLFFPSVSGQGLALAAFGAVVVGLRVLAYVLLPGIIAYKLAMFVWTRHDAATRAR
ncbi:MAG: hypothetical protein JRH20_30710 [Deltaproteobacteria bacterium]|nr:hypothetical protein [Deltaproteobacteria bacterium]